MRAKIFYLSARQLIHCVNSINPPQCVSIPHIKVPDDAKGESVFVDNMRQAIGVVVTSESFDDIPEGHELPDMIGPEVVFTTYRIVPHDVESRFDHWLEFVRFQEQLDLKHELERHADTDEVD